MNFGKKEIQVISFCLVVLLVCVVVLVSIFNKNNFKFEHGEVGDPYKYITSIGEYNVMVVEDVAISNGNVIMEITADKNTFIDFLSKNGFSVIGKNERPINVELVSVSDIENGNGNIQIVTKILENKEVDSVVFTKLNNKKYIKFNLR